MNLLETTSQGRDRIFQTSFPPQQGRNADQKTLLLAEDDDDLRFVMECSLSSMGYVVVACADAGLALAAFHTHRCDGLVTDFEMPGKTGLELARELTSLQPSLPVLMITGLILSPEVLQEFVNRQWTYMSKPSNLAVLESVLKKLTTGHHPLAA